MNLKLPLSVLFLLPALPLAADPTLPGLPPSPTAPVTKPVAPSLPKPRPQAPAPEPEPRTPEEKAIAWQDPTTGHHYMFVPGKRNFSKAWLACRNRGWDLFNFRYLSAEEWNRFYESPVFRAMPWKTRFAGDPGEIREAKFWNSSEWNTSLSGAALGAELKVRKIDPSVEMTADWYDSGANEETSPQFATFCMYRGKSWYRCSIQTKCHHYDLDASHRYIVPMTTHYDTYAESGETREEAIARATKAATIPRKPWGEPGGKYGCEPMTETVSCSRER